MIGFHFKFSSLRCHYGRYDLSYCILSFTTIFMSIISLDFQSKIFTQHLIKCTVEVKVGDKLPYGKKSNDLNPNKSGPFPTQPCSHSGQVVLLFVVKLLINCKDKYCTNPTCQPITRDWKLSRKNPLNPAHVPRAVWIVQPCWASWCCAKARNVSCNDQVGAPLQPHCAHSSPCSLHLSTTSLLSEKLKF